MSNIILYLNDHPVVFKLIVTGVLILLNIIIMQISGRILFRTIKNNATYYTTRKRFNYFNSTILILIIIIIWSGSKMDFATYIGFISAGIAISLREIFTNIAAWLIIIFQKPFEVGDRITINNQSGDVIDIKVFEFVLMELSQPSHGAQSTGRIVLIPNNFLFIHSLTNASRGFDYLWNELEVRVSLESNWESAKTILEEMINHHTLHLSTEAEEKVYEASRKYMIHYQNLTPIVYVAVRPGHILLTIRYLCEPRQARVTENQIWQEILLAFDGQEDITLL